MSRVRQDFVQIKDYLQPFAEGVTWIYCLKNFTTDNCYQITRRIVPKHAERGQIMVLASDEEFSYDGEANL